MTTPQPEREPTWQPIDSTPMHPEYPCAHCIQSGAAAGVIEAVLGSQEIPEVTMTSTTAPGVTHRWTNSAAYTKRSQKRASGPASITGSRPESGRRWAVRSANMS